MKLNTKITITVLQVALVPWVLGGILAYLSSQEQINNKTFANLDAVAGIQKNRLQETLQNKEDILNLFSASSRLAALLRNYNEQPTPIARKEIQDLIDSAGDASGIRRAFVATGAGIVVASTDRAFIGANVGAEDYFKRGVLRNDVSTIKRDAENHISHYLAGPLIYRGATEGAVVVVTDADDITSISQDYTGLGNTGEILVAQRTGNGDALFLTPTRLDPAAALTRVVAADEKNIPSIHAIGGEQAVFANLVDYRHVPVFAATRYIESVDWGIVVKIDRAEAFAPVEELQRLFFLVILMAGLLMALVGVAMAKSITGPISVLTVLANKIAQGDLQQSIVPATKDEVGMLAAAFNSMTVKLRESYTSLEKKVLERTKELREKTAEARDSEKAALNIAEDLKAEEAKLAEEKMRAESLADDLKKFKLALDNASDQVVITDAEGIVVYANAAVERITGYKPEEAIGKKSGVLWKAPMPLEYYKNLWHTIKEQKKIFVGEIQNKRKSGALYSALISISPVLDNSGNIAYFVGIERDITREKEIDTAKSEFISLASHQLRTPLTAVNWYSEMLLGGDAGKLNEKQKSYFEEIYAAGRQMNEIIKSFLHILRLETGKQARNFVSTDLVAVAVSVLVELRLEAEKKGLRVGEHYQKPLPLIMTDPDLVRVIIQNLVSNAIKYTPKEGELDISLESVEAGKEAGGRVAEHDSLLIAVRDTGIGIPAGDQDKVFMKFFRAENAKKKDPNGNGLGLYMTRTMVDIIGAAIWFTSEEGKGTSFYLLLPKEAKKAV